MSRDADGRFVPLFYTRFEPEGRSRPRCPCGWAGEASSPDSRITMAAVQVHYAEASCWWVQQQRVPLGRPSPST